MARLLAVEALVDLPPEAASVPAARRVAWTVLGAWGHEDLGETAALLVSELVTNSLLHARTPMTLRLALAGDVLRIEVRDGSPVVPSQRHHSTDATTGRGLMFLQELGRQWGAERLDGDTRKSVWVDVPVAGGDPHPAFDWLEQIEAL